MPVCVPVRDMRDTAKFSALVEASCEPVVVTKNGYDQFVVMRSKDYDALAQAEAKARLLERMLIAERERSVGAHRDARGSLAEIRNRYGLS